MKNPWRWSPIHHNQVPVTPNLTASRATCWRRRVAFVEDGWTSGPWPAVERSDQLSRWLALQGEDITVRLVFKVGGPQRTVAWLGLSADSATPDGARARLVPVAGDLGEALDAWALFEQLPSRGPRLARQGRRVERVAPDPAEVAPKDGACCAEVPGLLWTLKNLASRPTPFSVCLDARGGGQDAGLLTTLERLQAAADQRADSARSDFVSVMNGSARHQASLARKAEELADRGRRVPVEVRLHGALPHPLLLDELLRTLGEDLGDRASLAIGDTASESLSRGDLIDPRHFLGALSAGAPAPERSRGARAWHAGPHELPF